MLDTIQEEWEVIREFPTYHVSNVGRIYNTSRDMIMSLSFNTFGHLKVALKSPWDGGRHTRSVARLVAEYFVESPNLLCDHVVILDGDFSNVAAYNLIWRPRWFAWKYTHQLRARIPVHYQNLACVNIVTGDCYSSIVEAGMKEGLLFEDIWTSTYSGVELFPYGSIFEIVK